MILCLLLLFALSFYLTNVFRKLAIKHQILDHPNHRSAHLNPVPRGGGLAIIVSTFVGVGFIYFRGMLSLTEVITFFCAGFIVGLSGFLDDRFSLSPGKRLVLQLCAVVIGIYGLGAIDSIQLFSWVINQAYLLVLFSILYLLWLINLYNFMDGINGIAGLQSVSVSLCMACVYYLSTGDMDYLPLILAVCSGGFLYWNFPKGRIFMGDVGSGFLGLFLGLMSIKQMHQATEMFFYFLILMGVFIVDASFTLLRRFIQGKKIHQAHSSHAYQHAARWMHSHVRVSLAVIAINFLWLFPVTIAIVNWHINHLVGLAIAYAPLIFLAYKLKAGLDQEQINKSIA
jgi:Fuc2NAc and GlcNAc transferase